MHYQNVELHNITEVQEQTNGSVRLQRLPDTVRQCMSEKGTFRGLAASNAEIRFLCDTPHVKVTLSCANDVRFCVAHGSFLHPEVRHLKGGQPQTFEIGMPSDLRALKPQYQEDLYFAPKVFRILLPCDTMYFHAVEGENIRPPSASQVPGVRYLAYGTSITEGARATMPHLSYVAHAARRLRVDLLNFGMSGACHIEPELVDFMAEGVDWDLATLWLSVNMVRYFEEPVFRERVEYAIDRIAGSHPECPVLCLTMAPFHIGLCADQEEWVPKAEAFRQIVREAANSSTHSNVHLIEGSEVAASTDGLSADCVHPSDYGMFEIGHALAERLHPFVEAIRSPKEIRK